MKRSSHETDERTVWDVASVHRQYGQYVWATLQRMGVPVSDLDDLMQETLIVVHRNLHRYDPEAKISAWLFGICRRVTAGYRARAFRRHERLTGTLPEIQQGETPEEITRQLEARSLMESILERLDPEKRAVFVMFEVEELACTEIAEQLGVPVGTVYSRLHAARREVETAVERLRKAEAMRSA